MVDTTLETRSRVEQDEVSEVGDAFEDATDSTPRPSSNDFRPTTNLEQEMEAETAKESSKSADGSGLGIASDGAGDMPENTRPTAPSERSISPRQSISRPISPETPQAVGRASPRDKSVVNSPPNSGAPPQPGHLTRKASSGFGALLGRMGTIRKSARSPSATRLERRNTAASTASVASNEGGTNSNLRSIVDGPEGAIRAKPSLQDQFSHLRRQKEFSTADANAYAINGDNTNTSGIKSQIDTTVVTSGSPPSDSGLKSPPLDPALPPGIASGLTAGPSDEPSAVNWDLWQQVVYEGPSAVARTSGDELNHSIGTGIPAAIRGVVWQVLAESKSQELELLYWQLKATGTTRDQKSPSSRAGSSAGISASAADKESAAASETSSIHSEQSTAAHSSAVSPPTSVDSNSTELQSKLGAEKQKRDAAALQKLEKAIKRDLGSRTSYSKYTQSAGLQDGLFGVCKAYALYDEGVGYAQGINFIAMPLLFNMAEEEAFALLVRLMNKFELRSLFTADMTGLHLRLYQFERLLEDFEPAVYCHLKRRDVSPQLYATQWFLTIFAYRFPLQLVLRIYDLIFSEGLTAILKFGIVLVQHNRKALLEMTDMSQLTTFMKESLFDVYIDKSPSASSLLDSGFFGSVTGGADKEHYRADEMVRDACNVRISNETLAAYTLEWEEAQRTERERETELETLRVNNVTLAAQVRGLEERIQQHDLEHVQMAQDLVRIKVENDSLQDVKEGLTLQVGGLRDLLDAQADAIEEKLKAEMDRIMERNIEVQNENRELKEGLADMRDELASLKETHVQTKSDHETLKHKWASIQALTGGK